MQLRSKIASLRSAINLAVASGAGSSGRLLKHVQSTLHPPKRSYLLSQARKGLGYGDQKLLDVIAHDGLTDAYNKIAMGLCAEKTASDLKISREAQDEYCKASYRKHFEAGKKGILAEEIVPIKIKEKGKEEVTIDEDEEGKRYKEDKIASIPPAFSKTGTITAANASKINDGACSISISPPTQFWPPKTK